MRFLLFLPLTLALSLLSVIHAENASDELAQARTLLEAFLNPDADLKALTAKLRPTAEEVAQVYAEPFATRLHEFYEPAWDLGKQVIGPKEGQTALLVDGVPSESIRAWDGTAKEILPGGYEEVKDFIKPGFIVHRFKFVKPGETSGMAFDGLIKVGQHWIILPKPWRGK